jgi:hypothetical protein
LPRPAAAECVSGTTSRTRPRTCAAQSSQSLASHVGQRQTGRSQRVSRSGEQHSAAHGAARTCGGITVMACLHDCFCRDQTVVRQEEAPLTGVDHLVALGAYATYHARMASPRGGQPPSLESSIRLRRECRAVHTWAIKRVVCMCVCVPCGGAS